MRPMPLDRLACTMEPLASRNNGPDLALWESAVSAYRKKVDGHAPPPGSNHRTEAARARLATVPGSTTAVSLYVDPICPYTWVAACWLREVGRLRGLEVRHHVMSLHLLNAGGVFEKRFASMVGPSRVAMAVEQHHGCDALRAWHREFGHRIFDHWRYPSPREYRGATLAALVATGLPPTWQTPRGPTPTTTRSAVARTTRPCPSDSTSAHRSSTSTESPSSARSSTRFPSGTQP